MLRCGLRNIYIEFNIDLSSVATSVKDKISGFQITKVERTASDKSVVAQGLYQWRINI